MTQMLPDSEGLRAIVDAAFAPGVAELHGTAQHLIELVAQTHNQEALIGQVAANLSLYNTPGRPGLLAEKVGEARANFENARAHLWSEVERLERSLGASAIPFADTWRDLVMQERRALKAADRQAKIAKHKP